MNPSLLIVDDEPAIRASFALFLSRAGFEVSLAESLEETRTRIAERRFDIVLLDLNLPDGSGLDYIIELKEVEGDTAIVVITGAGDVPTAVEAMRRGADHFLCKPVNMADLEVFLRKGLEVGSLRRQRDTRQRLAPKSEEFLGRSRAMLDAMEMAALAAQSDAPVLIMGETGVGKGVMARWIHRQGTRRGASFVELNCSSLKGDLLASELFGHVRGAFTSAVQDRRGLLDLADGGTLFLDEIGDMELSTQAQFLKVLEEKRFRRLGESHERRSDFRLLCATNKDLGAAARSGTFREDLLFRINVLPIPIPALRERLVDLGDLAKHLLEALGRNDLRLAPETLALLSSYHWPGNVREIRNLLERAALLCRGTELRPEHFPGLLAPALSRERGRSPGRPSCALDLAAAQDALRRTGGDIHAAAALLGVSRATLYRRLKSPPKA